jgi:hypothetical protein
MNKLILLALVCTGFLATTPFTAQALDSEKIPQYGGFLTVTRTIVAMPNVLPTDWSGVDIEP